MIQKLGIVKEAVLSLEQQIMPAMDKAEVCGLLAGTLENPTVALAYTVLPLPNLSGQEKSFAIDPKVFYDAKLMLEKKGQTVLALYHSHPYGLPRPSPRDLELPKITHLLALILAPTQNSVYAACYNYAKGRICPVEVIAPYSTFSA